MKSGTFLLITMRILLSAIFMFVSIAPSSAQVFNFPQPGVMVKPTLPSSALLKGVKIDPQNPFQFDFIIDQGSTHGETFEEESRKLIKYFLASMTIEDQDFWVNLSPYEQDRIIPDVFGQTEMGRDMLAQDYLLKQLTASLMYPEEELGRSFWNEIYSKAFEEYGTTEIPFETFNKVWIVPEKAVVYEGDGAAFVVESTLKAMLEVDYLALEHHNGIQSNDKVSADGLTQETVREIILPMVEREINEGAHFAPLRQIYHALILATWYKQKMKRSLLAQVYANQNKSSGVDHQDLEAAQKIWEQYAVSFKQGVYDYIKEEYSPNEDTMIPRRYFAGGVNVINMDKAMAITHDEAAIEDVDLDKAMVVRALIETVVGKIRDRFGPTDGYWVLDKAMNRRLRQAGVSQDDRKNFWESVGGSEHFNAVLGHMRQIVNEGLVDQLVQQGVSQREAVKFLLMDVPQMYELYAYRVAKALITNDVTVLGSVSQEKSKRFDAQFIQESGYGSSVGGVVPLASRRAKSVMRMLEGDGFEQLQNQGYGRMMVLQHFVVDVLLADNSDTENQGYRMFYYVGEAQSKIWNQFHTGQWEDFLSYQAEQRFGAETQNVLGAVLKLYRAGLPPKRARQLLFSIADMHGVDRAVQFMVSLESSWNAEENFPSVVEALKSIGIEDAADWLTSDMVIFHLNDGAKEGFFRVIAQYVNGGVRDFVVDEHPYAFWLGRLIGVSDAEAEKILMQLIFFLVGPFDERGVKTKEQYLAQVEEEIGKVLYYLEKAEYLAAFIKKYKGNKALITRMLLYLAKKFKAEGISERGDAQKILAAIEVVFDENYAEQIAEANDMSAEQVEIFLINVMLRVNDRYVGEDNTANELLAPIRTIVALSNAGVSFQDLNNIDKSFVWEGSSYLIWAHIQYMYENVYEPGLVDDLSASRGGSAQFLFNEIFERFNLYGPDVSSLLGNSLGRRMLADLRDIGVPAEKTVDALLDIMDVILNRLVGGKVSEKTLQNTLYDKYGVSEEAMKASFFLNIILFFDPQDEPHRALELLNALFNNNEQLLNSLKTILNIRETEVVLDFIMNVFVEKNGELAFRHKLNGADGVDKAVLKMFEFLENSNVEYSIDISVVFFDQLYEAGLDIRKLRGELSDPEEFGMLISEVLPGIRRLVDLYMSLKGVDEKEAIAYVGKILSGLDSSFYAIFRYVNEENVEEFFETLAFWRDGDNLESFQNMVNELLDHKFFKLQEFSFLLFEIFMSKSIHKTVTLRRFLDVGLDFNELSFLKSVVLDDSLDLNIQMAIADDVIVFSSIYVYLNKLLEKKSKIDGKQRQAVEDLLKAMMEIMNGEIKSLVDEMQDPSKTRKDRTRIKRKIHASISDIALRFLEVFLGRNLSDAEREIVNLPGVLDRIITISKILSTLDTSGGYSQAKELRAVIKYFLNIMFLSAEASDIKSVNRAFREAIVAYSSEDLKNTLEQNGVSVRASIGASNKETVKRLVDEAGFDLRLWTEGIEIEQEVSDGITESKRQDWLMQVTHELVEIAVDQGVKTIGGEPLTMAYEEQLTNTVQAKRFVEVLLKEHEELIDDALEDRLVDIVDYVERLENLVIDDDLKSTTFRATLRKDLLLEGTAGVGVPGCFAPNGIHKEMPLVHAVEANVFFAQVFNQSGRQVGNAVVVLSEEGAFVYSAYNASQYDLSSVYGELILELSKYAPRVLLEPISAGYDYLKDSMNRLNTRVEIEKPATVITRQYFDSGSVDRKGNLSVVPNKPLVVNNEAAEAFRAEKQREVKKEVVAEVETQSQLKWQSLANILVEKGLMRKYGFLLGPFKQKVAETGRFAVDDDYYEGVVSLARARLGEDFNIVEAENVADVLIDFLEEQEWALDVLTPLDGDRAMTTKGGVDFNPMNMNLVVQGANGAACDEDPEQNGCINFNFSPEQIEEMRKNISGFTPVILDYKPLQSLPLFLGVRKGEGLQQFASS